MRNAASDLGGKRKEIFANISFNILVFDDVLSTHVKGLYDVWFAKLAFKFKIRRLLNLVVPN